MSADLLRRAASLMRERAEAVEAPGGDDITMPWAEAYGPSTQMNGLERVEATHIASWHPDVALAVADWLDDEADEIPPGNVETKWGPIEKAPAVRVARFYLGESA